MTVKPIVTDEHTGKRLWRGDDCAEYCGISPSTWRRYSSYDLCPQPIGVLGARMPLWDAEEVKAWHAARPGSPVKNSPKSKRTP